MKKSVSIIFALCLLLIFGWARLASADAVTDWNANAGKAAVAACIAPIQDPLHEARIYAMMHLAIHDALNAIDQRSRPYTFDSQAPSGASVDAAVATAAHDVLIPLLQQIPAPFPPERIAAGVASVKRTIPLHSQQSRTV